MPSGSGPRSRGLRPYTATGNYLSIHTDADIGPATYTLNFENPVQFLSFVFGSLDKYNTVELTFSNGDLLTLTGAQIVKGAAAAFNDFSGLAGPGITEGRASYNMLGGAGLTSITFSSDQRSFEIDSIAIAAPEPATWGMMLLGFAIAGIAARRGPVRRTVAA